MAGETRFWVARELGGMELLRSDHLDPAHPKHTHETFTVGIVDTGVVVNQSRGETSYLPEGSFFAFHPGQVHSGYATDDRLISHRSFYPSENALTELARDAGLRGTPHFKVSCALVPESAARLRWLHRLLEHSANALERETAVTEVFGNLLRNHTSLRGSAREGLEPKAVETVRAYLDAHFRNNVTLDELAALVDLNRAYLIRVFGRSVGMPPYSYLVQKRVEHARRLLRAGTPPAQVALEVGFSDQSHLTLHFKRRLNVTPGRYARSHYLTRKAPANLPDFPHDL